MSLLSDSITLYKREMLIFKANLRTNLMRSAIFPIVIIVFFGSIGSTPTNVPVAVVNLANNPQSLSFLGQLSASRNLQITSVTSESTALSLLQNGDDPAVVIILPTFPSTTSQGIQVYYSNTQVSAADVAVETVDGIAAQYSTPVGYNNAKAVPQQLTSEALSNPLYGTSSSYKTFLAGGIVPMVIIFTSLFGGGMSLISDRQMGNIKAFLITPINKDAIMLSRIFSGVTQGLLSAFIALGIGLLDGATIAMFWPLALVYITIIVVLLSAGFSGIALILASKIKKVDAFAIFSQAVGLPLWFISGGIVPIQSLPSFMQPIAAIDPLTYANSITRSVMIQGNISPQLLVIDLGILFAFAVFCMVVSFMVFKSSSGIDN